MWQLVQEANLSDWKLPSTIEASQLQYAQDMLQPQFPSKHKHIGRASRFAGELRDCKPDRLHLNEAEADVGRLGCGARWQEML